MDIQQGQYNPDVSNNAKETGGNLDDIKTNTDKIIPAPATEEKQDNIITAVGNISDPVGLKDTEMAAINPAKEDGNLAAIKTAIETLDISKTIETELLAITAVAANAQQKSSELDTSSMNQATVFIDHARDAAAAFVGAGTEYRIEVSEKATGNDTWRTLYSVVCGIAAASSIVMDAEEAAGQTVIEIGATTPAVGDIVFFENGTIANSEWGKVVAISAGVSFTLQDGLTNTQAAITLFNKAEQFVLNIGLKTAKRLRVIVNNNNGTTNRAIISRIAIITS